LVNPKSRQIFVPNKQAQIMETKVIKTDKGRTALYTTNFQATPETPAGYPFRREVAEFIGDQVYIRQDGHYAPHYAPESSKWQLYFLRLTMRWKTMP
jgi:hypothetical protein